MKSITIFVGAAAITAITEKVTALVINAFIVHFAKLLNVVKSSLLQQIKLTSHVLHKKHYLQPYVALNTSNLLPCT